MSNLLKHAQRELEISGLFNESGDFYGGETGKAVMELMEKFSEQGHSGSSAPLVSSIFKKLANYEPLSPITGEDSEWSEPEHSINSYQNKRLSSVFKQGKNGKAYYLDAIVWKGEEPYDTFTGSIEGITSRQYIRFPFSPKTFYIDVVREKFDENNPKHVKSEDIISCGDGDYVYFIKDKKQLEEVFQYYDKFETKLENE